MARRRTSWKFKKGSVAEVREWLVAMTGLAALIVAVVTFWTTARISGLEDYLRSEISRRNADLNTLSAQTATAERLANARAERLASLETATNEIIASSLAAQSRLVGAEADLARVRSDVGDAKQQLAAARSASEILKSNFGRQTKAFDLFQRQQAYQTASFQITTGTAIFHDGTPDGAVALEYVQKMRPQAGQASLNPYLQIIKDNIGRVCPRLAEWKPTLPERGSQPPRPTISYVQGTSRQRIAELTREAQDRWSEQYSEFVRKENAYSKAGVDQTQKLWEIAGDCVCSTLTTSEFTQDDVCPGRRS